MPPVLVSLVNQTLNNTIGASLLGLVFGAFLFGITTLQMFWYYHSYQDDTLLHKVSVAILWTLDAFHLALAIHAIYTYVISGFGNFLGLLHIQWSLKLQVAINVVILLMVHCLYASRVWKLSGYHRGFLGYIAITIVTVGFGIGMVLSYKVYTLKVFTDVEGISWAINAALATSTAIDFFIAVAMCYYLRKSRGQGTRLNSRIAIIMQYTLSTGLLTSACSLSAMFSFLLLPNTLVYLGITFFLTKLYVGSFLAMLNARERHRSSSVSEHQAQTMDSLDRMKHARATSSFWSAGTAPTYTPAVAPLPNAVCITTQRHVMSDDSTKYPVFHAL